MTRRYYRSRSRRRSSDFDSLFIAIIILGTLAWGRRVWFEYLLAIAAGLLVVAVAVIIYKLYARAKLRRRLASLDEIDVMTGPEFEQYIAGLLKKHGFKNISLTEKYDMGVDIVAEKNGERWGIQTKRYHGQVKAEAVRQVIAGLSSYRCNKAMVITNSTFSGYAIKLARNNHCILIDRMELAKLNNDAMSTR